VVYQGRFRAVRGERRPGRSWFAGAGSVSNSLHGSGKARETASQWIGCGKGSCMSLPCGIGRCSGAGEAMPGPVSRPYRAWRTAGSFQQRTEVRSKATASWPVEADSATANTPFDPCGLSRHRRPSGPGTDRDPSPGTHPHPSTHLPSLPDRTPIPTGPEPYCVPVREPSLRVGTVRSGRGHGNHPGDTRGSPRHRRPSRPCVDPDPSPRARSQPRTHPVVAA
jgi:hypothetical protein